MATLRIENPANGERLAEIPADDDASVAAKAAAARAAQPRWAAVPLVDRKAAFVAANSLSHPQHDQFRSPFLADQRPIPDRRVSELRQHCPC